MAGSIEDIFLSCSEPKRNVVEPSLVSVGTATMIHCRRCWWWWCVQDVRLKIAMHRCDVWTCMSAANACWIVLCKCMLDIKCSVLRGWSCAITKSFEFWLRTVEKMGLTLSLSPSHHIIDPLLGRAHRLTNGMCHLVASDAGIATCQPTLPSQQLPKPDEGPNAE